MKTLYFEGAGCVPRGNVPNCRIRTAFHTDDGRALYLEVSGMEVTQSTSPIYQKYTNVGHIDHCHYIIGVADEGYNSHKIERQHYTFEYSMKNLLLLLHKLGAYFEAVEVLPDLAGYRVHKDGGGYNYGDEFYYDRELTAKREAIRAEIFAMEKAELEEDRRTGAKKFVHSPGRTDYPNFSLWVDHDPKILHLLRHFNGYNKHWTIDATAENWRETMTEAVLGRYGC